MQLANVIFVCLFLWPTSDAPDSATPTKARSAKDGKYISWREHRIDDEGLSKLPLRGTDGLAMADLDSDGHLDIVSVHEDSSHVRIAFGTKNPDRWINKTLAQGKSVALAEDVAIGDLNGDGRKDIVVAAEEAHIIVFLSPPNSRRMSAWKPIILDATRGRGSWIRVRLADVDGDGKLEIFAANKNIFDPDKTKAIRPSPFSFFLLNGKASDPKAWQERILGRTRVPINIRPVDIDGDGDIDVLASSWLEKRILLFENLGKGKRWRQREVHAGEPTTMAFMMELADLDGDQRLDIVVGAGPRSERSGVVWLKQPKDLDKKWQPHRIGSFAPDKVTGLVLVDLNDDKRLDLFVGGYSWGDRLTEPKNISAKDACGRLAWFEQPKDPAKPWTRHDVSRRRRGMFDMFIAADVNKDGLVDLITTRGNSGSYDGVLWLEQVRTAKPAPAFRQARKKDSPEVALP